jgi:hypothetical protein
MLIETQGLDFVPIKRRLKRLSQLLAGVEGGSEIKFHGTP